MILCYVKMPYLKKKNPFAFKKRRSDAQTEHFKGIKPPTSMCVLFIINAADCDYFTPTTLFCSVASSRLTRMRARA